MRRGMHAAAAAANHTTVRNAETEGIMGANPTEPTDAQPSQTETITHT